LIFINETGDGLRKGHVTIHEGSALITATGESAPTVHLVDSESDFSARLDVTPFAAGQPWQVAVVTVRPPPGSRFVSVLVGVVGGTVLFRDITIRPLGSSVVPPGQFAFADDFSDPKLSKWLRQPWVDRVAIEEPGGHALRIGTSGDKEVGTYTPILGPISSLPEYVVSARIRPAGGLPHFKIAIAWIDAQRRTIAYLPDWSEWAGFAQPLVPARISLWHPRRGNAINLEFGASLRPTIAITTQDARGVSGGKVLGDYVPGATYHISLIWKHARSASFVITTPEGKAMAYEIDRSSGLGLFDDPFVNLSIQASAPRGATSSVEITNPTLIIPARTRYALNVSDLHLIWLTWGILAWLLLYASIHANRYLRSRRRVTTRRRARRAKWRVLAALAAISVLAPLYLVAGLADGHPFDRLSNESAAYVVDQYGIGALFGRTSAIPDALIRGGTVPWNPAEFVYPPGMVNVVTVIAKTWQLAGGSINPGRDRSYALFYKFGLALFILVTAGLLFLISNTTSGGSRRWAWLIAVLFALSPAVIFDAPIWGQTNALLSAVLLLAVFALLTGRSRLMWSCILIALLLKQTALLVVGLLAVFALRRFGPKRTAIDAAFGIIVGFAFMAPFVLSGYHPSTAYLTTIEKLIDFGTPLTQYDTQVSADTFPVWVLFTGFNGLQGHDRLWASDHATVGWLNLTYADAGVILFLVVGCTAALAAWRAAGATPNYRRLFLCIALAIVAYVTLNTRTSGHYLTLALPFLLLGMPRGVSPAAFWKFAAVSASAVVSMYGLFMFIAVHGDWPSFAVLGNPATNALSALVYRIYTSDVFITLFAALMVCVTAQLLVEILKPTDPSVLALAPPAAEAEREVVTAR
jgi:hypothetical protein